MGNWLNLPSKAFWILELKVSNRTKLLTASKDNLKVGHIILNTILHAIMCVRGILHYGSCKGTEKHNVEKT